MGDLISNYKKVKTIIKYICVTEKVTKEKFIKSILDCDEYGRKQKNKLLSIGG